MRRLSAVLPDFPWDTLLAAKATALTHPDGLIDLSIGTPVDPTPEIARAALARAADSPGYPLTSGTPELREAIVGYLSQRWRADGLDTDGALPLIGSKELVAGLPSLLGLGTDDVVVYPAIAYPTYQVGAALAGCQAVAGDDPAKLGDLRPAVVWVNSPSNPTGEVLGAQALAERVRWARERGAVLVADECYGEFGWESEPVSVLDPEVNGGSLTGLLAVHSLSKRSNLAGYRAGFIAGDPELVGELLAVRKHAGLLVPRPVQEAMIAVLGDQDHVAEQRARYLGRRAVLRPALEAAGFTIEHSEGGIYVWATRGEHGRRTLDHLAERGILVAPGDFYGATATPYVRFALTASDDQIAAAADRLT